MTTNNGPFGFGLCPVGHSIVGYGLPYQSPAEVNPTGNTSRKVVDGHFVMDENGNFEKATSMAVEMVSYCLGTRFNSSAIPYFGNNVPSLQVVPESAQLEITNLVLSALSDPINRGVISNVVVEVEITQTNAVGIAVSYLDILENETRIYSI